ncbi:hypothetical protein EVAR_101143_1 [Eumeta japonica]|uniref:Histone-lysine N-methyltransferase SETMAR n=1 Tax=Eumeta variegata TaxID=151549 RepID=A0A4C2ADT0_EUMVA|nr:hypothetical protein EVAR_101143_1 [Eumeta japonica]
MYIYDASVTLLFAITTHQPPQSPRVDAYRCLTSKRLQRYKLDLTSREVDKCEISSLVQIWRHNHQFGSLVPISDETNARIDKKTARIDQQMGVVFHHDNARPHTPLATQQILREFGWQVNAFTV